MSTVNEKGERPLGAGRTRRGARCSERHPGWARVLPLLVLVHLVGCDGEAATAAPTTNAPSTVAPETTPPVAATEPSLRLGPGFTPDPHRVTGVAGGPVDAASLHDGCFGRVTAAPNHVVTATGVNDFGRFRLIAWGEQGIALTVRYPDGTFECDGHWPPGRGTDMNLLGGDGEYGVWVGAAEENARVPYTLAFTTHGDIVAPAESLAE